MTHSLSLKLIVEENGTQGYIKDKIDNQIK